MSTRLPSVVVLGFALVMIAGCGDSEDPAAGEESTLSGDAKDEVAAPAAPPGPPATDEAVVDPGTAGDLTAELAKLEDNIASLEKAALTKGQQMQDELQDELLQGLEALQHERDRLQEKAEAAKTAGAAFLHDLFDGLNDQLDTLERRIAPADEE